MNNDPKTPSWIFFLRRVCQLELASIIVGTLLPLTFIVVGLTALNLERAVFSFIPLLVSYVVLVLLKATRRRTLQMIGNEND